MQNQVNLDEITDPKELKAMAYDQLAIKEQADRNLSAINQRLVQVSTPEQNKDAIPPKK